ncbi:hypothetical protein [Helicobacter pylori]|uniref:hypothetical protein n=1 Tax=Helicobacter pylori TaxID=210 RepID=UPI0019212D83|nr:hypothetical protein [Helicobacter pylori]QQW62419.1 hypothetical protein HGI43_07450 [Helicobacter pylori]QQW63880.1 hypothetical protein HGI44_07620 [Helicobacter pylori]QQW68250.1 hypothetical protein HGK50_07490 [Helicobacter pylori]
MKIKAIAMALLLSGVLVLAHGDSTQEIDDHYNDAIIDTYTFDLSSQQTIRNIYKAMFRTNNHVRENREAINKSELIMNDVAQKIANLEKRIKQLERQLKQAKK